MHIVATKETAAVSNHHKKSTVTEKLKRQAANEECKVNMLLVEDDDVHIEWARRCIKKSNLNVNLTVETNGYAALKTLEKRNQTASQEMIEIILLDINMPEMNGFEFLEKFRELENIEAIEVYMLTTSDAYADREKSHQEKVDGYLLKDSNDFLAWLSGLMLPKYKKLPKPSNKKLDISPTLTLLS